MRSGLQREYGSIFGSNVGLPTFQGNVVDQDRQFGTGEMFARGLASLAPGPIGTILSQVGKTKPTLDTSPTYKAELDPNSPDYEGSGYFGQLTNMLTGGAGTQIGDKISSEFDALVDGISFLNKPTNDKDLTSMTDPNYKGSATANVGITSLDPVANNAVNDAVNEIDPLDDAVMDDSFNRYNQNAPFTIPDDISYEYFVRSTTPGTKEYEDKKQIDRMYAK